MNAKLLIPAAAVGLMTLAGFSTSPTNAQIGTGAGAVIGGVAGNAVFGNTLGTVGGAAAGALIGNEVGKSDGHGAGPRASATPALGRYRRKNCDLFISRFDRSGIFQRVNKRLALHI